MNTSETATSASLQKPIHTTRYASLDHWRGFAAIWVVLVHCCYHWGESDHVVLKVIYKFSHLGWFGVQLFFVISGYCIAERAARALAKNESARAFLLDRALRILPTYWAALIIAMVLAVIALPFNHLPLLRAPGTTYGALPSTLWAFLGEVALLAPFKNIQPYLMVSWTLTCEIVFYLMVSIGIGVIPLVRNKLIPVLAGYTLAVLQLTQLIQFPFSVLRYWPVFMSGILAWLCIHWSISRPKRSFAAMLAVVLLGLLDYLTNSSVGVISWSCTFALLLIGLKRFDQSIAQIKALRWLGYFGTISFSIYLVHFPITGPFQNLIGRLFPESPGYIWDDILVPIIILPPSWLFFRYIEQPLENWRRRRKQSVHN
jgi:exopolysaccharide production protein ExoZ